MAQPKCQLDLYVKQYPNVINIKCGNTRYRDHDLCKNHLLAKHPDNKLCDAVLLNGGYNFSSSCDIYVLKPNKLCRYCVVINQCRNMRCKNIKYPDKAACYEHLPLIRCKHIKCNIEFKHLLPEINCLCQTCKNINGKFCDSCCKFYKDGFVNDKMCLFCCTTCNFVVPYLQRSSILMVLFRHRKIYEQYFIRMSDKYINIFDPFTTILRVYDNVNVRAIHIQLDLLNQSTNHCQKWTDEIADKLDYGIIELVFRTIFLPKDVFKIILSIICDDHHYKV